MKTHKPNFILLIFFAIAGFLITGNANAASAVGDGWEKSIVTIEVSGIQYDFRQPWSKQPRQVEKSGVVIGKGEILTTAQGLDSSIMVRLQRLGESRWWDAQIKWLDYHANLAIISAKDEKFFNGLKPSRLWETAPDKENLHIIHWKGGNLETRRVEFNQYVVDEAELSPINYVQMELEPLSTQSLLPEIVISRGKVAGLTTGKTETGTRAIPAPFIKYVLNALQKGNWRGLGYFSFYWQPSQNPALHQFLNLKGEPRGVVVINTSHLTNQTDSLKPLDIILEVDGFPVDSAGNYKDPDFGKLLLENLAVRNKFAGDTIWFKVWRDGKEQMVKFTLPPITYSEKLVPQQVFDREPEYLIVGGLVFQPLSEPYLKSFGSDWRKMAPFRLVYLDAKEATAETPSLVILSLVLPDYFNIGYNEYRGLVVSKVNNIAVHTLKDMKSALNSPVDGYHIIEFQKGDSLCKMVIDAKNEPEITTKILKRFGIPSPSNISD
ncbi:MAG: PDZ domain-containing protein [Verrucomicrobiia bacterium]